MFDREEAIRSLTGAFEIFLDRPDAMRHFDLSESGFWRSFGAIVLVAPLYALSALADREISLGDALLAETFDDGLFVLEQVLGLSLDWVTMPIVLALVARRIGVARTYGAFIIARNWGSVLSIVPFAVIGIIELLGFVGAGMAYVLSLASLFVVLRFQYLIVRRALEAPVAMAIGVVVLDFALGLTIAMSLRLAFGQ